MKKLLYSILICLIFASCEEVKSYDPNPKVEFLTLFVRQGLDKLDNEVSMQELHIRVTDGDGNIGLNTFDTTGVYAPSSEYYNNLFVSVYSKQAGEYIYNQELSQGLKYRMPYNEPRGQNKYLRAEIKVDIQIPVGQIANIDTVRYDFFVYDRLFNKSEIVSSPDICLKDSGWVAQDGRLLKKQPKF